MSGNITGGVQFSQVYNNPQVGTSPSAIVGSMPPQAFARSVLDARRMMQNRTPNAQYPDGYLGTITSRRGDRLLDALKARENQRSYQRGVHMGERIDPGDYLYPDGQDPLSGIRRQATTGERYAPELKYFTPTPMVEGRLAPRGATSVLTMDEHRSAQLALLRPNFGYPARRNPRMG